MDERTNYRSRDGSMDFDLYFQKYNDAVGWRVYIINKVNYKSRSKGASTVHRLHESGETYDYICWSKKLNTLAEAKSVAALWCDATAEYINTGGNFNDIAARMMKE